MNKLIQLSQNWHYRSSANLYSSFQKLAKNSVVKSKTLKVKKLQLMNILNFWEKKQDLIEGAIISAYYDTVVPKTHRIQQLFRQNTTKHPNNFIVGVRYLGNKDDDLRHVITYHVKIDVLKKTISEIEKTINLMDSSFNNEINNKDLERLENNPTTLFKNKSDAKRFAQTIIDASYVEKFDVYFEDIDDTEEKIVSLYDLKTNTEDSSYLLDVLRKLGINKTREDILDRNVVLLDRDDLKILKERGSFLVYAQSKDLFDLKKKFNTDVSPKELSELPEPNNEPIVGVIDTTYKELGYFKGWVEYDNDFEDGIDHGNEVTSIIVAGPKFNPGLEDNCGLFRVHHFGITRGGRESSFRIVRRIREIVEAHPEIHVWNLSLGSPFSTNTNRISNEAAVLDKLQAEHPDILFIIAGTNLDNGRSKEEKQFNRIGSPADSVNSLVVNSVDVDGKAASYARKGPVLHYFVKPDVCYYGGDITQPLVTATSLGEKSVMGTSFAAPWIARKASFLMDKMHFSRETTKALIIDSASGWLTEKKDPKYMGYGVVPIDIRDVINCKSDEIRFIIRGISQKRITYSDGIPVPKDSLNKFPFIARATLAYFPTCSPNQGVDYTDTELSLQFGRIEGETSTAIKSIVNDNNVEKEYIPETDLRRWLGKWENVKVKAEKFTSRKKGKGVLGKGYWGLKLVSSERLYGYKHRPFNFAVVVTLKNLKGQNLNEEFKQLCIYNNWRVSDIDIDQMLQANLEGNTEINWTDDIDK